jgi:hypothetical protein
MFVNNKQVCMNKHRTSMYEHIKTNKNIYVSINVTMNLRKQNIYY